MIPNIHFHIESNSDEKMSNESAEPLKKTLTKAILGNWIFTGNSTPGSDLFIADKKKASKKISVTNLITVCNDPIINSILDGTYSGGGVGATGVQGATGVSSGGPGQIGPSGASGPTGVRGETGISTVGASGVRGASGVQGPTGVQGATGLIGNGATGVKGDSGVSGGSFSVNVASASTSFISTTHIELIPTSSNTSLIGFSGSSISLSLVNSTLTLNNTYGEYLPIYVAAGNTGIYYSADRSNWTTTNRIGLYRSLKYANGLWMTTGSGDNNPLSSIQYSTDGTDWYNVNSGGFNYGGYSVTYANNLWVALGLSDSEAKSIQYSGNGSNWSNVNSGGFTSYGIFVTYANSLWMATGNSDSAVSSIQYSGDGSNWSNINRGGFTYNGNFVTYANSLWMALGFTDSAISSIQYSGDGSNWSNVNSGGFTSGGNSVAYANGLWVATGDGDSAISSIQYSGDGSNWSNINRGGFTYFGKFVTYANSLWVAVGDGGSDVSSIQYSGDGSNWSNANRGGFTGEGGGNHVIYKNNMWIATGNTDNNYRNSILYSGDGSNWSNINSGGFNYDGKFVESGFTNTLVRPILTINQMANINLVDNKLAIENSVKSFTLNSNLTTSINSLAARGTASKIFDITYISTGSGNVYPPAEAKSVRIINMAGGGAGGSSDNINRQNGAGGGGGGGTILYTTLTNNYNISYNTMSTIGNYSTCAVYLNDTPLYAFYGNNGMAGNIGSGGNAYGPTGSILITGTDGYLGGNYNPNGGTSGKGLLGGLPSGLYGGGGMGGGPTGGAGGSINKAGDGGFGSGGGGVVGQDSFDTTIVDGGMGGPPLITFEWM